MKESLIDKIDVTTYKCSSLISNSTLQNINIINFFQCVSSLYPWITVYHYIRTLIWKNNSWFSSKKLIKIIVDSSTYCYYIESIHGQTISTDTVKAKANALAKAKANAL